MKVSLLGVTRPAFLVLTPICVLLGVAAVRWTGHSVDWLQVVLILVGATAAHVAVNTLNEYADFRSGLDLRTRRTPFSGGSGTLVARPELAPFALALGIGAVVTVVGVGLCLAARAGWLLVPFGLAGVLLVVLYTKYLNRNRYLVLIAPGLGFGPLMVAGTYAALTGELSGIALLVSLVPFFLVSNLLLLNQFPDIEADRSVGRDNFPVAVGTVRSAEIYAIFALLAYLSLVVGAVGGVLPATVLAGLVTVLLVVRVARGAREYGDDVERLVPLMGTNVLVTLVTPTLVALGLFTSAVFL